MKKRGISPLIATVLLIGITIMVSFIVFTFIRTTVEEKINETEMQSNIILACAQTLKLEYDDPMLCGNGNQLDVTVWNKSPLDIIDLKIQILSDSGSYLEEVGELTSYTKKVYEIEDLSFDVDDINKIFFIPTIELDEFSGICSGIGIEINQINPCII